MQGPRIVHEGSTHDEISRNRVSATPQPQQTSTTIESQTENIAHEIGLVSVTAGQDPRYVGPSSGYSFAKLVLATSRQRRRQMEHSRAQTSPFKHMLDKEAFRMPPARMPSNMEHCMQLSAAYWEDIHFQYPFLHRPTHLKLVEHMHDSDTHSPVVAFQVYMVLAISATILSTRLKVPLSAEGYCATAMTYFDQIQIEGSLEGLQCLLLLQMYALNNASTGLNVWYLNYQCIASVLDLGLQRDVRTGKNLSLLTQEMRTRIFWVVYSLDRTLATIMGRPIGLRDEACELRVSLSPGLLSIWRLTLLKLPQDISDDALSSLNPRQGLETYTPSNTAISIHLIKLAKLNSEIKYIANSISRKTPPHSYPHVPDVLAWKEDVLRRLQQWASEIPRGHSAHVAKLVELKYHEVVTLLLRPSPAIPRPSYESLELCQRSATATIRIFDELYRNSFLPYTWPTVHSVFLATISILYCIWTVPSVTKAAKLDILMTDLNSASSVLSALGEYWFDAKRSRDLLDELSQTTIRWLIDLQATGLTTSVHIVSEAQNIPGAGAQSTASAMETDGLQAQPRNVEEEAGLRGCSSFMDAIFSSDPLAPMFSFLDETNAAFDIDSIMQGVFSEYQPDVEFGDSFPLENQITGDTVM
jgi:hypothetical protein